MKWLSRRRRAGAEKKRRRALEKQYIIRPRLPTVGDYPVDYLIPLNLSPEAVAEQAAAFLKHTSCDRLNAGYLDLWLESQALEMARDLARQKEAHRRSILLIEEELEAKLNDASNAIERTRAALAAIVKEESA